MNCLFAENGKIWEQLTLRREEIVSLKRLILLGV